ncbi:MAG: hypothetical protein H6660_19655 [Ardenticatenaceae bacterium]|nr:hypothetical protein [Ardenticatenaceae bacterium]
MTKSFSVKLLWIRRWLFLAFERNRPLAHKVLVGDSLVGECGNGRCPSPCRGDMITGI